MSITVRLWSKEDLQAIDRCKTQEERWLATVFMNVTTFGEEEIKHYPYNKCRTYSCRWYGQRSDVKTIYATDIRMLLKFIDAEYTRRPDSIDQVIIQYRPVILRK